MDEIVKEERILGDRVRKLAENTRLSVAGTFVNSIILVFVLRGVINKDRLFLWLGVLVAVSVLRIFLQRNYREKGPNQVDENRWKNRFTITLFISGTIWGSAGIFLFPSDSIGHQVFLAFVLGGMVAGSVGVFSVIPEAFLSFSIPALLPIVVRFFSMGNSIHYSMGTMVTVFWCIMLMAAIRQKKEITNFFALKYENVDLIKNLETEIKVRENAEASLLEQKKGIERIVSQQIGRAHV